MADLVITIDDPHRPDVVALLARHLAFARATTPPELVFALDVDGLADPSITFCRSRGYRRISLETGSQAEFEPARSLYGRAGFTVCGPFSTYPDSASSVFMTRLL